MNILRLSWINLISNKLNTLLSILLLTFGVGIISILLLVNKEMDDQLQNNLRGIDMVLGAKGSPLQLILSTVYHVDNPTGNIPYKEVAKLRKNRLVESVIPVSFGDSYQGFRIVGTEKDFFALYNSKLAKGRIFKKASEVVLGHNVADKNDLAIGATFFGVHGLGEGGEVHDNFSYRVVGILEKTNSVVDKLIVTSTESVWEVHNHEEHHHHEEGHHEGEHEAEEHHHEEGHHEGEHETEEHHHEEGHHEVEYEEDKNIPEDASVTAMLVKFRNPVGMIQIPRFINENTDMQAAVPAYEVSRLVSLMGIGFNTINIIALVIIIVSGLSIFIGLYNALNKRKAELALIRVHGASRWQLVQLVLQEGILLTLLGTFFGLLLSRLILWGVAIFLENNFNFGFTNFAVIGDEIWLMGITLMVGLLASILPTIQSYYVNIPKTLMDE